MYVYSTMHHTMCIVWLCMCTILPNLIMGDKQCAGDLTRALAVNVDVILGDYSDYFIRGTNMYTQDKRTLIASVHFLVYFVAVPGEKVIIIHSINHLA